MTETYSGSVVNVFIAEANEQDYVTGATSLRQSLVNLADHDHSANPLGSTSIANLAIDTAQLADGSVTSAKLASGITVAVIANNTNIEWRNAANSADVGGIKLNSSDNITITPTVDVLTMTQNTSLKGRNAADSADVEMIKVDSNDDLSLGAEVSLIKLKNSTYLTGRNNADSGNLNGWKFNTSDLLEPGIGINFNSQIMSNVNVDSGAVDGITIGTNSAITDLRVDNLKLDGNTLSSTSGGVDITPLAGQAITLDSNVTVDGGVVTVTGQLNVDSLRLDGTVLSNGGTEGLSIDSSGAVTKANQPGFYAYKTADSYNVTGNSSSSPTIIFDSETFDSGGDYDTSTGVFTAPVAGNYLFCAGLFFGGVTAAATQLIVKLVTTAGVNYILTQGDTNEDSNGNGIICASTIIKLSASDTVHVVFRVQGEASDVVDVLTNNQDTHFTGYLLG